MNPKGFEAGRNIAMKVPPHQYEATVRFYRDTLGFESASAEPQAVAFKFGSCTLWIDSVAGLSQAEIWLEVVTDDVEKGAEALRAQGVVRCDEIEPLPRGFSGFWIMNPASIVHLVCKEGD